MAKTKTTTIGSEDELVQKAKEGDRKAFTEIIRRNEQMVYSFAFKVCRNKEYAEETYQDAFVNVFQKLKQFNGKSKFSTWLYSIVSNCCLMKRRKRKLEKESISIDELIAHRSAMPDGNEGDANSLLKWNHTPFEIAMTSELRKILDEAIQKLPVDYRLVFVLRDIEGKSTGETAKILKLSVPAVKSRLRRARLFLKDQLSEYVVP
jgi:RNA polymerase sigma-70 factor (ECF subfamily)